MQILTIELNQVQHVRTGKSYDFLGADNRYTYLQDASGRIKIANNMLFAAGFVPLY